MMTPIKTSATETVYKRSEFSDLLTSNNFYTVSAIALVLGIASAFGFIQNPRKLKAVVDTLSYKVSISHMNNQRMSYRVFQHERYNLSASLKSNGFEKEYFSEDSQFDQSKMYLFGNKSLPNTQGAGIARVAFSYDITSNKFWNDLNSSNIGQVKDELRKDNYDSHSLSLLEEGDAFLDMGDSKYSIATGLRRAN